MLLLLDSFRTCCAWLDTKMGDNISHSCFAFMDHVPRSYEAVWTLDGAVFRYFCFPNWWGWRRLCSARVQTRQDREFHSQRDTRIENMEMNACKRLINMYNPTVTVRFKNTQLAVSLCVCIPLRMAKNIEVLQVQILFTCRIDVTCMASTVG